MHSSRGCMASSGKAINEQLGASQRGPTPVPNDDAGGSPRPSSRSVQWSRAFGALVIAAAMAGCGGGSSGGGGGGGSGSSGGGSSPGAGPVNCDAIGGGGEGYAVGVCTQQAAAQLQAVDATVVTDAAAQAYTLNLAFPTSLPAGLSGSTTFTAAANRTPDNVRNVIGVLRGAAYESPRGASAPNPPYVALTSFQTVTDLSSSGATQSFTYTAFGIWEEAQNDNGGYFGPWYSPIGSTTIKDWSSQPHTYSGVVAGVLSPYRAVEGRNAWTYGFSAKITIAVGADGRIIPSGSIVSDVMASYPSGVAPVAVPISALTIQQATTDRINDVLTGAVVGPDLAAGAFRANYFGSSGSPAREMAGQIQFRTLGGVLAVGAFGLRQTD